MPEIINLNLKISFTRLLLLFTRQNQRITRHYSLVTRHNQQNTRRTSKFNSTVPKIAHHLLLCLRDSPLNLIEDGGQFLDPTS